MKIGEAVKIRIIELCNEQSITVNKLSIVCGITQSTINNITEIDSPASLADIGLLSQQ